MPKNTNFSFIRKCQFLILIHKLVVRTVDYKPIGSQRISQSEIDLENVQIDLRRKILGILLKILRSIGH